MKAGKVMKRYKLQNRLQNILMSLLDANDWCTSAYLSRILNVTDRTIRNDMNELSAILHSLDISITSERSKGYLLDNKNKYKVRQCIEDGQIILDEVNEELHISILMYLLELNQAIDLDELSDKFYISKSTLEEKIKKIKSLLYTFNGNVHLLRKKNLIQVNGDEKSIRQLLNFLIIDNDHSQMSLNLKYYSNYFDYEEMIAIQKIAIEETQRNDVQISDIGLIAIVVHIMININRIRAGLALHSSFIYESKKEKEAVESLIAVGICRRIEELYGIEFNEYEVEAIAYYVSFRRFFSTDIRNDLDIGTNQMLSDAVKEILKTIKETFLIDLTQDTELINGLVNHFRTFLQRFSVKISYQNPILEEFKDKYPFIFELAVFARKQLEERLEIELNEDEVGYVAIDFGAAVEKLKFTSEKKKINLALISHLNYPESQLLISKLRSSLSNLVNVYGPFSVFHIEDAWDCDPRMILTTTNLYLEENDSHYVKINAILTRKDLYEIERMILKIIDDDKRKLSFSDFFKEDFFYSGLELGTKEEVIHELSKKLYRAGIVNDKFETSVLMRENFSTTVLMNLIALPHPMEICANETVVSIALLKRPIIWSKRKVQIIFMMAVAAEDQHFLASFYELVADLSDDINFVNKMLKAKTFDEFIKLINDYER